MTVGESLGSVFPISISLVQGEQPTSSKFTGWANQTSAGLTKVAKAIGDIWGEEFSNNKLFVSTQRPTHIMNLARLIGPSSALNPLRPVAPATRVEYDVSFDPDDIPANINEFNLREDCNAEPPIDWTSDFPNGLISVHSSIETALSAIDGTVFATRVASRELVNSTGKYYVDTHGNVLTYNRTSSYGSSTQTYQTTMAPDMYDQATLNVIPDMNQSTSDGLCDIISNTQDSNIPVGEYVIRTPYLTKLAQRDAVNNPLEPGDDGCPPASFATTERARLPYVLKASDGMNLNDGDQIPDGFLGLWDETNGTLVYGLTFKMSNVVGYDSDYCVIATGGTLTAGNPGARYRIITIGTTITETLANLIRRFDTHTHNDRHDGYPVWHENIYRKTILPSDVSVQWSMDVQSPPSAIPGNDHPQYLCRYGWTSTLDTGQYDNAMLGDLFMAAARSDYTDFDYTDKTVASRKIIFGDTSGPSIYLDGPNEELLIASGTGDSIKISAEEDVTIEADESISLYPQTSGTFSASTTLVLSAGTNLTLQNLNTMFLQSLSGTITAQAGTTMSLQSASTFSATSTAASMNLQSYGNAELRSTNGQLALRADGHVNITSDDNYIQMSAVSDAVQINMKVLASTGTPGTDIYNVIDMSATTEGGLILPRTAGAVVESVTETNTALDGMIYYNSTDNEIYLVVVSGGGHGLYKLDKTVVP